MAKTYLFHTLRKALRDAAYATNTGVSKSRLADIIGGRDIDRRHAIALAASGLATSSCKPRDPGSRSLDSSKAHNTDDTVVILGGGVSGLTAAFELAKADVPFSIFEAEKERLGGRMYTMKKNLKVNGDGSPHAIRDFNREGMFCELGAELIDTGHVVIRGLCRELGLVVEDFPPADTGLVDEMYNIFGKTYDHSQLIEGFRPLAPILARDRRRSERDPDFATKLDNTTLKQYLTTMTSIAPEWVLRALAVTFKGELGLETDEQSSLNLITVVGTDSDHFSWFGESDEISRVRGGNARLIEALVSRIRRRGEIRMDHRLVRIHHDGNLFTCHFATSGSTQSIRARQIICTIPFTVLRQVEGVPSLGLSPGKLRAINELGYGTNSKFMIGFNRRAWRNGLAGIPANTGSAITDDGKHPFEFWETSRVQPGISGILTNFMSGRDGQRPGPARRLLQRSLDALDTIYNGELAAFHDNNKVLQPWPVLQNFMGSYACARPGQFLTLFDPAATPELGGRLLFAGEHTSERAQGFMEGAAESGQRMARSIIRARGLKHKAT